MPVLRFVVPAPYTHSPLHVQRQLAALTCAAVMCIGCDAHPNSSPTRSTTASRARESNASAIQRDDFGRPISFGIAPKRLVSLNPTTTELIFALGAGNRVVGRSRWDEWPEAAQRVPEVGDGIRPNVERIIAARPDLVLLYASEDNRAAADRLADAGIPTLSLRIDRVADFDRAIRLIGRVLDDTSAADHVADTVAASLARVRSETARLPHPSVVWPLANAAPMVVGGGSFMNDLIEAAGGRNIYGFLPQPSPAVSIEDVIARDPDIVIRGGEGATPGPLGPLWRHLPAVSRGQIATVPSDVVLRPSVQMGSAARSIARALHPGVRIP